MTLNYVPSIGSWSLFGPHRRGPKAAVAKAVKPMAAADIGSWSCTQHQISGRSWSSASAS